MPDSLMVMIKKYDNLLIKRAIRIRRKMTDQNCILSELISNEGDQQPAQFTKIGVNNVENEEFN